MGVLIVRHKVRDFTAWKKAFENDSGPQRGAGLTNPRVFRSSDDRNEIVIMFEMRDAAEARKFATGPELKSTMAAAGVTDQPTAYFLEEER